jgi:hypothetical protein
MEMVNPDTLRLVPGQSMEALFTPGPELPEQIGFFLRSGSGLMSSSPKVEIRQKAGLIRFDDVLLVLTMIRVNGLITEMFDIWWNYFAQHGDEHFKRIARQEMLTVHFYTAEGKDRSIRTDNRLRSFFKNLPALFAKTGRWSDIEFDRAVRGFCAQFYPKENLWDMLDNKALPGVEAEPEREGYPGYLPEELTKFYVYVSDKGHCVKIIPSILEQEAIVGDPREYLYPAPVKTVLRGGFRWVKGFPVAPIPLIPGYGLATPPDDVEL